jgi:archaeal chaperonin
VIERKFFVSEQDPFHLNPKSSFSTLKASVSAVKAVADAVAPTIGPKGLDTMLIDPAGQTLVTNAGATILAQMKVDHPVAKMMIKVGAAQYEKVGDGTTTATLLAAALVEAGAKQILRGAPTEKVIAGIEKGVDFATKKISKHAFVIQGLEDDWLQRIAMTASRGHEDLTLSVIDAAQMVGLEKLKAKDFRLADSVIAHRRADNIVFMGMLLHRSRMNTLMPAVKEKVPVLVLADSLQPEMLPREALQTEAGFVKQEKLKEGFETVCRKLVQLEVGLIVTGGSVHRIAEEIFTDAGIIVVTDVDPTNLQQIAEYTGAHAIKRNILHKSSPDLKRLLGFCQEVEDDDLLKWVRMSGGQGKEFATILVGAATDEIVAERERICRDVASAVQAAVHQGFVPGGGAVELSVARDLEQYYHQIPGLERYGVAVVAEALHQPMFHVIQNAGFNPLEKIELIKHEQTAARSHTLGLDTDFGTAANMIELGVVDPLSIKLNALKTACEVSTMILRIHHIVHTK